MNIKRLNTSTAIDELGKIKAQIAELEIKEKELKKVIIEMGPGSHEGDLFRATVTEAKRANFDIAWAKEKLGKKLVDAHTTYSSYVTVKVLARTGEKVEEDATC